MSKYFSGKFASITPYVPGEQPKMGEYIKLNTNESPFPPPPSAKKAAFDAAGRLHLYSDPENTLLTEKMAATLGVKREQVLMTNGSDEGLNFAFMAYCDEKKGIRFADITYGFYSVFAALYRTPTKIIPLKEDFSIDYRDYLHAEENIIVANPNAPTGLALPLSEIEEIVRSNRENIVIVDEAYVDFGGESAVRLIDEYDNLLVVQTFSKSRSLAGGRLGVVVGNETLIADLKAIKYSTNPFHINGMTAAVGCAVLEEKEWFATCVATICENREYASQGLRALGFTVLPSKGNFLFAKSEKIGGEKLYKKLKERGVLVRHFTGERIKEYNRITVGTKEQMQILLRAVKEILEEEE